MLNVLDTLIVRETVAQLPDKERKLAQLLMAGETPQRAAHALRMRRATLGRHLARLRHKFRRAA
jgi:FixJ family two-component response regulator